jgi:hypothetical protein
MRYKFIRFNFLDIHRLKMMIPHRMFEKKDSIINILTINNSDILNLHPDHLHQTNLVIHMFKVLNVKVVAQDVIVNVPERVLWVLLVRH